MGALTDKLKLLSIIMCGALVDLQVVGQRGSNHYHHKTAGMLSRSFSKWHLFSYLSEFMDASLVRNVDCYTLEKFKCSNIPGLAS